MIDIGEPPRRRTLEALLRLISPGPAPVTAGADVDWTAVTQLALHSHVAPMLWHRLKGDSLLGSVPPAMAEQLRSNYVQNARRNRLLKAEIAAVARRLNAAGHVPLLLKGGAYIFDPPGGNGALRYLHDLDFLAADAAACQRILLDGGFAELGRVARPRAERSYHHWPALVDPSTGLEVEVHKRPFITADAAMTALFLDEGVPVEHDGARLMLPSRACRIVGNVVHAQISDRGFGTAWFNPRYLLEFAEYAVAWTDRDWALAEAALLGNRIAYGSFRHLAQTLMGVSVPSSMPIRWIDTVQHARIRRHDIFRPRRGLLGFLVGRVGLTKDRLRRRYGRFVGWHSVPRDLMNTAPARP